MARFSVRLAATLTSTLALLAFIRLTAHGADQTTQTEGQAAPNASQESPQPVELTANQDHKRMMKLLGIESVRPGRDGNESECTKLSPTTTSRRRIRFPNCLIHSWPKMARKSQRRINGGTCGGRRSSRTSTARFTAECRRSHQRSHGKSQRRRTKRSSTFPSSRRSWSDTWTIHRAPRSLSTFN